MTVSVIVSLYRYGLCVSSTVHVCFLLNTGHGGHSHSHSSMPPHNHSRLTQLVTAGADANATDDNENDERFPPQHFHDHIHEKKVDSSTQMNMHGVFLHVLADALGSVIVIISATVSM